MTCVPKRSDVEKKIREIKAYYNAVIPKEILGIKREHIIILGLALAFIGIVAIGIKRAVKSEVEGYIDVLSQMELE